MLTPKSPFLSAPVRALGEIGALFRLSSGTERRRHPRVPAAFAGEMSVRRADLGLPVDAGGRVRESVPIRVCEISLGGLGLSIASEDLPRGNFSLLGLKLDLLRGETPVTVRLVTPRGAIVVHGEIVSSDLLESEPTHLAVAIGLSFRSAEELPRALQAWIAESRHVFTRALKALKRRSSGLPVARELVAALGFVGLADEQLRKLLQRAAQSLAPRTV